jgi:hypothetical protein
MLALAAGSAWGQGVGSEKAVFVAPPASEGCPVGFSVQRRSAAEVNWASSEARDGVQGLGLGVVFVAKDAGRILKVDLTVHGMGAGPRMMPAAGGSPDGDVTEIFQLARGENLELPPGVWMRRVKSVRWVDLTEIEYADGSVWKAAAGSRCRVAPSLLVMVAAAR